MDKKLAELMSRFVQLGQFVPNADDLDTDDAAAVAEAKMVIDEMMTIKAEIDTLIKSFRPN